VGALIGTAYGRVLAIDDRFNEILIQALPLEVRLKI